MQASRKLVTSEIEYETLENKLNSLSTNENYILDGFPRNIEQAIEYDEILKKSNKEMGLVIVLDIPKDLLTKRITGRFICKDCGSIYNIYNEDLMPHQEGLCNKCNGELYQRKDDTLEAFEIRYQTYLESTVPLIDFYQKRGILHIIDSSSKDTLYTLKQVETLLGIQGDSID